MKIILSIIIMFLSTQSFADLKGKGLYCSFPNIPPIKYGKLGIEFVEGSKYEIWKISRLGDSYTVLMHGLTKKYERDENFIYLEHRKLNLRINRKTLKVDGGREGLCELTQTFNQTYNLMSTIRDRLQKKYDAEREGNKI